MSINKDITASIFFLLLSIVLWIIIPVQIAVSEQGSSINAQFMPKLVVIFMGILSALLLIKSIKNRKKNESSIITLKINDEMKVLLVMLILVFYAVTMPIIGFIFSSLIACAALLLFIRAKIWMYITVILAVFFIYFMFTIFLNIRLPAV